MAETAQLIERLKRQMDAQQKQMEERRKQTEALIAAFIGHTDKREQPSPKAPLVVIHREKVENTMVHLLYLTTFDIIYQVQWV